MSNVVLLGLKVHEPFLTDEAVSKLLARRVIIPHWETVDRLRFLFPLVQVILDVHKERIWPNWNTADWALIAPTLNNLDDV